MIGNQKPAGLILGFFREKRDIEEFKFKAPSYQRAYHELIDGLAELGVKVAILMGNNTYQGNGVFTKHWVQIKTEAGYEFEKRGLVTVDAIWVKDQFDYDDQALQVNSAEFRRICSDKNLSYELLAEFHPKSLLVQDAVQLHRAFQDIPGQMIAVKTPAGNSGINVYVGLKADFDLAEFNKPFPYQVQEYVETKNGIPGIIKSRHDFRVVLMDGQPVIATLRTPPEGQYKSNIGYGGFTKLLGIELIPKELLKICSQIDQRLAQIGAPRYYSADFGLTDRGWILFEINSMPGTINRDRGPEAIYYQQELEKFLVNAAQLGREKRNQL